MAYKVIKAHGSTHGKARREFICDTAADVIKLPTSKKMGEAQDGDTVSDEMCAVGSTASVTETGDLYELNASNTWVKKPVEGSGEGSDITIDNTLTQEGQAADAKAVGDALKNKADSSALTSYVQTSTAESTYAKKSDLASKADSSALSEYVQTSVAESTYAKKSDLTSKADSADLANYVQTSTAESTYAKKTDLSSKADVSALSSYLQSSTAESTYAKKTDLSSKADASALANYVQTSTAESTYAKKSELPSKGTAVADAGDSDVKDKLNALLASLRTAGVIATE